MPQVLQMHPFDSQNVVRSLWIWTSKPLFEVVQVVEVRPENAKPRLAAHVTSAPSLVESSLALETGQAGQACAQGLVVPQLPAISQSDPALRHLVTRNAPPTQGTLLDRHDASRERSRTPEKVKFAVVPQYICHWSKILTTQNQRYCFPTQHAATWPAFHVLKTAQNSLLDEHPKLVFCMRRASKLWRWVMFDEPCKITQENLRECKII